MKKFFAEFRTFIARGNVMDMAIGMIIGAAFTSIVNSLVNDVIMPLISIICGGINFDSWNVVIGSGENAPTICFGTFVAAILNFLIVALIIFCVVKALNTMQAKLSKPKEKPAPTTKKCPYCCSEIPIEATKCPHCTSELK